MKTRTVYRVISETHGLLWSGTDEDRATDIALIAAIGTAHTVYLQEGSTR